MKLLDKDYEAFRIVNRNYLESIEAIVKTLSNSIWNIRAPQIVRDFTDHGINHSLDIITRMNTILKNNLNRVTFHEEELYLLVVSAFLHDIGLQCDPRKHSKVYNSVRSNDPSVELVIERDESGDLTRKTQTQIRDNHHKICVSWLEQAILDPSDTMHHAFKSIPKEYINDVANICKYHSKLSLLHLPTSQNNSIDQERLILLFRIADELDIGDHRINSDVLDIFDMPDTNAMHWYINMISSCELSEINDVSLTITLSKDDCNAHIATFRKIIRRFEQKNKNLMERLRRKGIWIAFSTSGSNVEMDRFVPNLPDKIINAIYLDIEKLPYINNDFAKLSNEKKKKLSCYLSFCENDVTEYEIRVLSDSLERASNYVFEVNHFAILKNQPFKEIINDSECIIRLITKGYLDCIKNEDGPSFNEYSNISKRFLDEDIFTFDNDTRKSSSKSESHNKQKGMSFIIKFDSSLNKNDIVSNKILNETEFDFLKFRNDLMQFIKATNNSGKKKSRYEFPINIYNRYKCFFKKMHFETYSLVEIESERYKQISLTMRHNFLLTTKSDSIEYPDEMLVHTRSFQKIINGQSCFVIGRKGSGKSTILSVFSQLDPRRYKGMIKINVDKIDLRSTFKEWHEYDTSLTNAQLSLKKDVDNIFVLDKTFKLIWDVYLYVSCIHKVYEEYINGYLVGDQLEFMQKINAQLLIKFPYIEETQYRDLTGTIYTFAKEAVFEYLFACVKEVLENSNLSYPTITSWLVAKLEIDDALINILGQEIIDNFNGIVAICKRKIMITMDNFDTNFEFIRRDNINEEQYASFEKQWLRAFLELVYEYREKRVSQITSQLAKILDFVICIPSDRYLDFLQGNRDAYKYNNYSVDLCWSGPELADLLRKRLEYLWLDIINDDYRNLPDRPEEKLLWLLKFKYPNIPDTVSLYNKCTNQKQEINLFQYVLRMSFWRPRDVLTHYANIIALIESCKNEEVNLEEIKDLIKKKIKETAKEMIVIPEFIGEFGSVIYNFNNIVQSFYQKKHILNWDELYQILNPINVVLSTGKVTDILKKFEMLYEIGFLGIYPTETYKKMYAIFNNHAFVFNERKYLLTGMGSGEFTDCKFIIHPIFIEMLYLCQNNDEIICNYDWNYLRLISKLL